MLAAKQRMGGMEPLSGHAYTAHYGFIVRVRVRVRARLGLGLTPYGAEVVGCTLSAVGSEVNLHCLLRGSMAGIA